MTEAVPPPPRARFFTRTFQRDRIYVGNGARSYDNQLESVSARVTSTHTGQIISGVSWQNGDGGVPGSPADRVMRQGLAEAAQTIAKEIAKNLRR